VARQRRFLIFLTALAVLAAVLQAVTASDSSCCTSRRCS
jgi:hypothetical protein